MRQSSELPFYDQILTATVAGVTITYSQFGKGNIAPDTATVAGWISRSPSGHGDLTMRPFDAARQLGIDVKTFSGTFCQVMSQQYPNLPAEYQPDGIYPNAYYKDVGATVGDVLAGYEAAGPAYGSSDSGVGKTVIIDYSSPNIAKPFGVGHLRSTVIGNSLYRILTKVGYKCVGINHLGDWGTQFGKMIVAFKKWGSEDVLRADPIHALFDLYTRFHREAKEHPELEDDARSEFRLLEQGDPEATKLWQRFKDYSLDEFNRIYDILGINFDHHTGESFYNDKIQPVLDELDQKGLTTISREALIVDLEAHKLGACLLRKGDDATLYATRDIAGILYRHENFGFEKCLYVVGAAQALHFQQVFKVIELAGHDFHKGLVHVPFGWVRFEDRAMSTREGNIIFLDDVISKATELAHDIILEKNPDIEDVDGTALAIGVGAVVFSQVSVRRTKDIDFKWEAALSFDGETGPYLQYTHARLCSLMRKYGKELPAQINYALFGEPEEMDLSIESASYAEKIRHAAEEYEPFVIASYLINLAQKFNAYYQKHRVISDDTALTDARIKLCDLVRFVLGDGLRLLGITPLERM
jgi:arginyl-tRNA synthetase